MGICVEIYVDVEHLFVWRHWNGCWLFRSQSPVGQYYFILVCYGQNRCKSLNISLDEDTRIHLTSVVRFQIEISLVYSLFVSFWYLYI